MSLYSVFKTLHIVTAIWLVIGILGRQWNRNLAYRSNELERFISNTQRAGKFERLMVIPGNMGVVLLGIILALMGGWPIFGFLQGSPSNWLLASILILIGAMLLVPLVYSPAGKRFDSALEKAKDQKQVSSTLRDLMSEPKIKWAHRFEYVGLTIVILLMIYKPF